MVRTSCALLLMSCAVSCGGGELMAATGLDAGRDADSGRHDVVPSEPSCALLADQNARDVRQYCERCASREPQLCCVAQGTCCVNDLHELTRVDFEACADSEDCDVPAERFGAPYSVAGGWVPAVEHSGLILPGSIESRARVRIRARLQASACSGCAELVGVGLSLDPIASASAPELSIVVSSELSQIVVASGTRALWSMTSDASAHDYELERQPDGTADLSIDGHRAATLRVAFPDGTLRAFLFGRTDAELPAEHARIQRAAVDSARCERTAYWQERASVFDDAARAPSVARWKGSRWLAYENDSGIELASAREDENTFARAAFAFHPSAQAFDARGLGDPELAVEAGALALYYTALGSDGLRSVGRMRFDGKTPDAPSERLQLLAPAALGVRELFAPSAIEDRDGNVLLVASAIALDGSRSLKLLRAVGRSATGDTQFGPLLATDLLRLGRRSLSGDYSALGNADLALRRGQYQLYFAAVSDGRWVTALAVSTDLQNWMSAGTVLAPGSGSAFDASGVQDPELFADGDELSLFYTAAASGDDAPNARTARLGRASRWASAVCGGLECGPGADCAWGGAAGCRSSD